MKIKFAAIAAIVLAGATLSGCLVTYDPYPRVYVPPPAVIYAPPMYVPPAPVYYPPPVYIPIPRPVYIPAPHGGHHHGHGGHR